MSNNERYDVFISYRQDGGTDVARLLHESLTRRGYSVYLDVDSEVSGSLDQNLYEVIEKCNVFLLVLSPNALNRCTDERDWVRLEVEHAYAYNKYIIPIFVPGFSFPDTLPMTMSFLEYRWRINFTSGEHYESFINKLENALKSHEEKIKKDKEQKRIEKQKKEEEERERRHKRVLVGSLILFCVFSGFYVFWNMASDNKPIIRPTLTPSSTPTYTDIPTSMSNAAMVAVITESPAQYFTSTSTAMPTAMPLATSPLTGEIQTGRISDSWPEILAAIDDGSARQRYAVGAWKPLVLDKFGAINMQLAGFDLDERADGTGKAPTTWIAQELLPKEYSMYGNYFFPFAFPNWDGVGWEGSDLRSWLQNEVLLSFPDVIKNRLLSVTKLQWAYDKEGDRYTQATEDRLWIPSYSEVLEVYSDLFKDTDDNRVKDRGGTASWWWLRSAYSSVDAYYIKTNGNYSSSHLHNLGGVLVGFCL